MNTKSIHKRVLPEEFGAVVAAKGQDRAYSELRLRLVRGQYAPGHQLREEPLALELGLSRTPVRSALKRLVEDGLATANAGQGIRVSKWSDGDIEEVFQIRALLEPHATELAVTRGGDTMVQGLEACNRAMAEDIAQGGEQAIARIQASNQEFHRLLLQHAGSPRLRTILEPMIDLPITLRSFFLYDQAEIAQSLQQHRDITQAAVLRDGELGRTAMQLHLRMTSGRMMRYRTIWRQAAEHDAHLSGPRDSSNNPSTCV